MRASGSGDRLRAVSVAIANGSGLDSEQDGNFVTCAKVARQVFAQDVTDLSYGKSVISGPSGNRYPLLHEFLFCLFSGFWMGRFIHGVGSNVGFLRIMMDSIDGNVNEIEVVLDSIGARLRIARESLGMSQEAFAQKAGVHRKTQGNYEANERSPDANYLFAAAELGVDVAYVVTGKGPAPAVPSWPDDSQIYASLLDTIRGELQLHKGFDDDWQALFDLLKEDWADFVKGGGSSRGIGLRCRALLGKSPYVEFDPSRLGDLLERVEFVAGVDGRQISARDKAAAVLSLRVQSAGETLPPSFAAVKSVLQGLGDK